MAATNSVTSRVCTTRTCPNTQSVSLALSTLYGPHTADLAIGPKPGELCSDVAFRVLPIAHQYDMRIALMWCKRAVDGYALGPGWGGASGL